MFIVLPCLSCGHVFALSHSVVFVEERTPTNRIAADMQACKELYELTLDIVAGKAPDIKNLAMPEPKVAISA